MSNRIGTLSPADRAAVLETARRLKIDPYELGAVIHKESGFNPNVWGGAGGRHYGLIQFGSSERGEAGLDPRRIGSYTIREQLPNVEKWLAGRGYRPGMGVQKLYATILGGNPGANIYSKDVFGTSVANAVGSFRPGGALYRRAQGTLGDVAGFKGGPQTYDSYQSAPSYQQNQSSNRGVDDQLANAVGQVLLNSIVGDILRGSSSAGAYGGSTQPSVPHSNESDVESGTSGLSGEDVRSAVAEALAAQDASFAEAQRARDVQEVAESNMEQQKRMMAALMQQAQASFGTPAPVF